MRMCLLAAARAERGMVVGVVVLVNVMYRSDRSEASSDTTRATARNQNVALYGECTGGGRCGGDKVKACAHFTLSPTHLVTLSFFIRSSARASVVARASDQGATALATGRKGTRGMRDLEMRSV